MAIEINNSCGFSPALLSKPWRLMQPKKMSLLTPIFAGLFLAQAGVALGAVVQFSAVPGASILFVGNGTDSTFSFPPNGVGQSDFKITSQSGGSSLVNLLGEITGSFNFTAASISTAGPVETAPVTSVGITQFIIHADQDFTGTLSWINIRSLGQGGFLNTMAGDLNLTGFSYGGSNPDLISLLADGSATVSGNFQFSPARDLFSLASTTCSGPSNPCSTSFAGSLTTGTPVPEPGLGAVSFVAMLFGVVFARRSRKAC